MHTQQLKLIAAIILLPAEIASMKRRVVLIVGVFSLLILNTGITLAQERSFLCKFTQGPRAGEIQDYTGHPSGPLPVGASCQDGVQSAGVIVSGANEGGNSLSGGGGSCVRPSSEEDCDACKSDRSYERCLTKVEENQ